MVLLGPVKIVLLILTLVTASSDQLPAQVFPAPSIVAANFTEVSITWTTPAANGAVLIGYAITGYFEGLPFVVSNNTKSTSLRAQITDLSPNSTYRFTVAAISTAGIGPFSALSPPITTPFPTSIPSRVPEAPVVTNISAVSLELSWQVPRTNGGSALQSYLILFKTDKASNFSDRLFVDALYTSATIGSLLPRTTYQFKIVRSALF